MDANVILVDRIGNVANGVLRIECTCGGTIRTDVDRQCSRLGGHLVLGWVPITRHSAREHVLDKRRARLITRIRSWGYYLESLNRQHDFLV